MPILVTSQDNNNGNPRNKNLINSINDIKIALVESFFPTSHLKWIE